MNSTNHIKLTDIWGVLIILLIGQVSSAHADEALATSIDCSSVEINYIDNPEWTHSERLEAMDKAFFESVDRFEFCNLSNQSSSSSSANVTGTAQASNTGDEAGLDSTTSPEMAGTEATSTLPSVESSENVSIPENPNIADNTNNEPDTENGGGFSNGAKPEDIPPADNDDAIAAQIRLAAEIEKDPVKKEKLWNEYRKYKGLPVNDNE